MRKIVAILIGCCLAAACLTPVSAGGGRQESQEYSLSTGVAGHGTEAHWSMGTKYQVFRPREGERFVSLTIADKTGLPARGHIHMDADGDGKLDHITDFCGGTLDPIPVGRAKKIEVGVIFGTCPDDSPAVVTQGVVTATFTK